MAEAVSLWYALPRPLREFPADLTAAVALIVATNLVIFTPVISETPLRIPLGLAFVLFVPGYAFIAALFPEGGDGPIETDAGGESPTDDLEAAEADDTEATTDDPESAETADLDDGIRWTASLREGIDGIERVALSFGLSIAIVPLLGLVLNFTPWGIRLTPIVLTVTAFSLVATAIAAQRRWDLPPDDRFRVPYRTWYSAGRSELLEPDSRADATLNVLLAASVLLAVGSVGYAVMVPPDGERFSAIYLLTEDDDGELVADDYPTEFELGESQELVVGVDNNEHRTVDYTVVVVEQTVETIGNETVGNETTGNETVAPETVVQDQTELERFETRLGHNESWHVTQDLEPTTTGEDVRIVWLLYPDDVPAEPSMETTDYHVHLWVDVES